MKTLPNIHPGEVLLEEFLKPLDISQNRLARAMGAPSPPGPAKMSITL